MPILDCTGSSKGGKADDEGCIILRQQACLGASPK